MTPRYTLIPMIMSRAVMTAWLHGTHALAAPAGGAVNFTPPLAAAKTIQVTEVIWEAGNGAAPGPLRRAGTMTFRIQRPDKFRVTSEQNGPSGPASYYVSDGTTMVGYDGKQFHSQPTARAEWPFPMMGLLNNMPGPVSAVAAVRGGRPVLLAVRPSPSGREEFWFDPKTHLLLRDMMFLTWQGKTSEVMRTEYSGWLLNRPLPPAAFRVPVAGADNK